ncbi:hypothetical protein HPC49_38715 [Pyxidicoccus fallax]|uniref:CCA tRNA nucleotidyltransferase n=1 Tax=Pyxidicoccus fallax TaxID=394095 RepID=A0A848LY94_9BACT|nr:hypothetical protein [Pyxidicoccus fallax]NMO22184.1 hypothetical protein [Pyxidicoccus fallax]NPC84131.1 hypothetical protein [Pyxidicoccus fallax]
MSTPLSAAPLQAIDASRIDPDALNILQRLHEQGHTAYLVGGCVRDLLVGRTPRDFDVATSATPGQVRALFSQSRGFGGRRFLVVQVQLAGGKVIEVGPFQARPAVDAAGMDAAVIKDEELAEHPHEAGTPEQDARSRDFTVNALFYDVAGGRVIDHVDGLADLRANRLRTIGDPAARLRENPGMMVRGVRLATRLGMDIEEGTWAVMASAGDALTRGSRGRLLSESLRGVSAGTGARFVRMLSRLGWLPVLLPPVARFLAEGPEREQRFLAHLEAMDRYISTGQRLNELVLACAMLLPITAPAGGLPSPDAMAAVLGELVQGAPELGALPRHGQMLTATLHQVVASPESVPAGNPLLPDARRLAALVTEVSRGQ